MATQPVIAGGTATGQTGACPACSRRAVHEFARARLHRFHPIRQSRGHLRSDAGRRRRGCAGGAVAAGGEEGGPAASVGSLAEAGKALPRGSVLRTGTRPTSSWQGPSRCGALLLGSNYPGLQRFHAQQACRKHSRWWHHPHVQDGWQGHCRARPAAGAPTGRDAGRRSPPCPHCRSLLCRAACRRQA
ncbi:unnamed protein product [Symbiodinium necroappetens]|uniref:Uncharacterized protein n=1 Tax=Symbiodinium necroappetens TaxID=1628268 RepID=A0A813A0I8_9DINO|nr:unnamed protein product [Symbiodinium necroappetens]